MLRDTRDVEEEMPAIKTIQQRRDLKMLSRKGQIHTYREYLVLLSRDTSRALGGRSASQMHKFYILFINGCFLERINQLSLP